MKTYLDWSAYDTYAGIPASDGNYAKAVAVCMNKQQCQCDGKGVMYYYTPEVAEAAIKVLQAEHYEASVAMGELALLPAVRAAPADAPIIADGFSCRHQIRDGAGREAVHVAALLAAALA